MSFFLEIDVEGINGIKSLILIPIYPISYLWFLNALFFCYLVVGFCEVKKINSFVQYIIYIVATILSFMLPSTNVWYYFVSNFSWILCFYIGFQLKEKKLFINKLLAILSRNNLYIVYSTKISFMKRLEWVFIRIIYYQAI